MQRDDIASRRAVLSAVAGGVVASSGIVAAREGPPDAQDCDNGGPPAKQVSDKGIVVRIENCKKAHVRGSEENLSFIEVTSWEEGIIPGAVFPATWTTISELPATIEMPGEPCEPGAVTLNEIEVRRFENDDFSVTPPADWDCKGLVEEYIEE